MGRWGVGGLSGSRYGLQGSFLLKIHAGRVIGSILLKICIVLIFSA